MAKKIVKSVTARIDQYVDVDVDITDDVARAAADLAMSSSALQTLPTNVDPPTSRHRADVQRRVHQLDRACSRLKLLTSAEGVVQLLLDLVDHDQLGEHVRRRMAELGQRLPAPHPGRWRP